MRHRYLSIARYFSLSLIIGVNACKEDDETEGKGNALLVVDSSPNLAVEGQDLTFNRIRIWQSNSNLDSPGVVNLIESYTVELWITLAGESNSRYTQMINLKADIEGNIFNPVGTQPGSIVYKEKSAGVDTYTVTAVDGLLTSNFPLYHSRRNEETFSGDGQISTFSNEDFDLSTLVDGPWTQYSVRQAPLLVSRTRVVKNEDFATKAKMACFVRAANSGGDVIAGEYILGDVELGISVKSIVQNQINPGGPDTSGDDDSLWITYQDSWFVSGINVKNKTIRTYRDQSAPYYSVRELPGVDTDQTTPRISGMESLLRTCNFKAGAAKGTFGFVNFGISGSASVSNFPYCPSLASASVDETTANAIPLSSTFITDGTNNCSFSALALGMTPGTWDGNAHTPGNNISAIASPYTYRTGSAIVETAF